MKKLLVLALLAIAVIGATTGGVLATRGSSNSPAQSAAEGDAYLGASVVNGAGGVTVAAVIVGSPADKGGVQRGDVIRSVDGNDISNVRDLRKALNEKNAGDTIALGITRNGGDQDLNVTLEDRPEPLAVTSNLPIPELNGIPLGEVFSHFRDASVNFTDKDGNSHTLTVTLGTVESVDVDGKTVTVNLNAGGSETVNVTGEVKSLPADLSRFEAGYKVAILKVDDDTRAIVQGYGLDRALPFLEKGLGRGFGHQKHFPFRMGPLGPGRDAPSASPAPGT